MAFLFPFCDLTTIIWPMRRCPNGTWFFLMLVSTTKPSSTVALPEVVGLGGTAPGKNRESSFMTRGMNTRSFCLIQKRSLAFWLVS